MPPLPSKTNAKRKAPAFKPPRPASKPTKASDARRKSPPTRRDRPSLIADQALASDDDDKDEEEDEANEDDENSSDAHMHSEDESDVSAPRNDNTNIMSGTQDPPPTIPPALLTKLLHHHFKDNKVRVGKDANGAVGKYMETFVREAIARAAFERSETVGEEGGRLGVARDFLEVIGTPSLLYNVARM